MYHKWLELARRPGDIVDPPLPIPPGRQMPNDPDRGLTVERIPAIIPKLPVCAQCRRVATRAKTSIRAAQVVMPTAMG